MKPFLKRAHALIEGNHILQATQALVEGLRVTPEDDEALDLLLDCYVGDDHRGGIERELVEVLQARSDGANRMRWILQRVDDPEDRRVRALRSHASKQKADHLFEAPRRNPAPVARPAEPELTPEVAGFGAARQPSAAPEPQAPDTVQRESWEAFEGVFEASPAEEPVPERRSGPMPLVAAEEDDGPPPLLADDDDLVFRDTGPTRTKGARTTSDRLVLVAIVAMASLALLVAIFLVSGGGAATEDAPHPEGWTGEPTPSSVEGPTADGAEEDEAPQ